MWSSDVIALAFGNYLCLLLCARIVHELMCLHCDVLSKRTVVFLPQGGSVRSFRAQAHISKVAATQYNYLQ